MEDFSKTKNTFVIKSPIIKLFCIFATSYHIVRMPKNALNNMVYNYIRNNK